MGPRGTPQEGPPPVMLYAQGSIVRPGKERFAPYLLGRSPRCQVGGRPKGYLDLVPRVGLEDYKRICLTI
jgi:hypothetical protein